MTTKQSLNRTVGPSSEPVTLVEARDQCEILASDTTHDTKLARYIGAAREQVENDTGYALITQTFTVSRSTFPAGEISIPVRPLQSVSGVTYYDADNSQQTLATSVYGLDSTRRLLYLKYNQDWPTITEQHDGIVITCVAGFGSAANVPSEFKQAILLQVTKWFEHRGDESGNSRFDVAYEAIIRRLLRTSYP